METSRSLMISASSAEVWTAIADIENAASRISGIKSIEILTPASTSSLVGLKWRETRSWMGKDAVEVMWITDARQEAFYETRAESHGAVYVSRLKLEATGSGTRLTMEFEAKPVTAGAKVMWALTGWMARRALKKTMGQDLEDIKKSLENTD